MQAAAAARRQAAHPRRARGKPCRGRRHCRHRGSRAASTPADAAARCAEELHRKARGVAYRSRQSRSCRGSRAASMLSCRRRQARGRVSSGSARRGRPSKPPPLPSPRQLSRKHARCRQVHARASLENARRGVAQPPPSPLRRYVAAAVAAAQASFRPSPPPGAQPGVIGQRAARRGAAATIAAA